MQIIPFEPEHLLEISPREFHRREMVYAGDLQTRGRQYLANGAAYTGLREGVVVGCAGIQVFWRGVGSLWMLTGALAARYPLDFHKTVRRLLDLLQRSLGLWRMEMAIPVMQAMNRKWIERLGFYEEGVAQAYGPDGTDFVRYAKITQELRECHF